MQAVGHCMKMSSTGVLGRTYIQFLDFLASKHNNFDEFNSKDNCFLHARYISEQYIHVYLVITTL